MVRINSREYIEKLIDNYQNLVFSICYKISKDYFAAEDLTQETFLAAFNKIDTFDGANEKAWIARIATNKSIDYINKAERRSLPTDNEEFLDIKSDKDVLEEEILENDFKRELKKNCDRLKPPYGEIARMFFYEEKTPKEIAYNKKKSLKTIQTQIYRARNMLRKIYEKER